MQKSFSSHGFIFEFHSQRYFTLLIPLFFNIRLSIIKCSLLTPMFRLFFAKLTKELHLCFITFFPV